MTKKLYLIRHGQVEESYQGKFVGKIDADLSNEGRKQMRKYSEFFRALNDVQYFCSPLKRAMDSFKIAVESSKVELFVDDNLKEIHFGNWGGLTILQIRRRYPDLYRDWKEWNINFQYPQGESYDQFIKRIKKAVKLIKAAGPENIVIFAHGGVLRFLICAFLNLDFSYHNTFRVDRGSKTCLDITRKKGVLLSLNSMG